MIYESNASEVERLQRQLDEQWDHNRKLHEVAQLAAQGYEAVTRELNRAKGRIKEMEQVISELQSKIKDEQAAKN